MIVKELMKYYRENVGFRLLNSEIGNDQIRAERFISRLSCGFRLLNSEIGNDLVAGKLNVPWSRFSSP